MSVDKDSQSEDSDVNTLQVIVNTYLLIKAEDLYYLEQC